MSLPVENFLTGAGVHGHIAKAGAVVEVHRGELARRYRVSGRRFGALMSRFAASPGWVGGSGRVTFDFHQTCPNQPVVRRVA